MNYIKIPLVGLISVALAVMLSSGVTSAKVSAVQGSTALERGYRTGYSDGYSAGIGDAGNKAARDYQNKEEYQRADRSFNDVWGPIEDYRDGYQQGFEAGYGAGYDRQQFDSTIPTGLRRRQSGTNSAPASVPAAAPATSPGTSASDNSNNTVVGPTTTGPLSIPRNTILSLELMSPLSTDVSQRNDPFKARITQPAEFSNCIVEGRVTQVKRAGKVKGVAELQLSFDRIRFADNRTIDLHAVLIEVVPMVADSTADVDSEGTVKGRDSTKDDAAKIGGATGIGAIIGVIAGGGKGAAIGSIIGAGAGTAGVMSQRGHDIRLVQGQQLKIRTSADTNVL